MCCIFGKTYLPISIDPIQEMCIEKRHHLVGQTDGRKTSKHNPSLSNIHVHVYSNHILKRILVLVSKVLTSDILSVFPTPMQEANMVLIYRLPAAN